MGVDARQVRAAARLSGIETDSDELADNLARKLFAMEGELGVATVLWYQMIGWIGDLADYAERLGNRLRC